MVAELVQVLMHIGWHTVQVYLYTLLFYFSVMYSSYAHRSLLPRASTKMNNIISNSHIHRLCPTLGFPVLWVSGRKSTMASQYPDPEQISADHANICPTAGIEPATSCVSTSNLPTEHDGLPT